MNVTEFLYQWDTFKQVQFPRGRQCFESLLVLVQGLPGDSQDMDPQVEAEKSRSTMINSITVEHLLIINEHCHNSTPLALFYTLL